MFRKLVNIACYLAAVHAEDELKTVEGTPQSLGEARDGTTVNLATIGESFSTQGDAEALIVYIEWTTQDSKSSFTNGAWIQSYAEYEDAANPGMMH